MGERAALGERATLDAWLQASDGSSTARPEVIEVWFVPGMHWQEEGEVYWSSGGGFVASRTLESSDGFVASHTIESSGEGFVAIGNGSAAAVTDHEQPVACGPGLATGASWQEAAGGTEREAKPRRRRKTDKYQLYVLSKHEESELKVDLGDVVDAGCAGCVGDDGITNYKKQVVDNDMEQHSFYSQCTYEHGDLRSVAEICGCDGCIDGKYSHCPLMARSGDRIVQYYLPPIKGPQQDEEAQRLAGAAAAFCMSTVADQLVVVPCWRGRKQDGAQVNYLAKLAAAPPPPAAAAAAAAAAGGRAAAAASGCDTGRATRSKKAAGKMPAQAERGAATAPVARDTEDGWPPHMYYKAAGTTSEKRAVMDCVWYEPHPTEPRRYVQCAAQSKVLLCAQVVPVKIPDAITEPVDGTAGGGFLLDPSAVSFIEGLNLLRFT